MSSRQFHHLAYSAALLLDKSWCRNFSLIAHSMSVSSSWCIQGFQDIPLESYLNQLRCSLRSILRIPAFYDDKQRDRINYGPNQFYVRQISFYGYAAAGRVVAPTITKRIMVCGVPLPVATNARAQANNGLRCEVAECNLTRESSVQSLKSSNQDPVNCHAFHWNNPGQRVRHCIKK